MKKLLTFALVTAMMFTASTSVFADFIKSPSNEEAPEIVEASSSNPNVDAEELAGGLTITPYGDRDNLPEELQKMIEEAYAEIKDASDLTDLVAELADVAEELNITTEGLSVSALFDVNCTIKNHETITLKLKDPDAFKNFVALLHYTDGEWEIVEGAKVDGDKLTFSADSFSPFAVVVATEIKSAPKTGVDFPAEIGLIAACAVLFGAAGVCLFVAAKKKRTNA